MMVGVLGANLFTIPPFSPPPLPPTRVFFDNSIDFILKDGRVFHFHSFFNVKGKEEKRGEEDVKRKKEKEKQKIVFLISSPSPLPPRGVKCPHTHLEIPPFLFAT